MKKPEDYLIDQFTNYIIKDPVKNSKQAITLFNRLGFFQKHKQVIDGVFKQLEDPQNPWYKFAQNFNTELNENARKKLVANLLLRGLASKNTREKRRAQNLQSPYAILMDPTSACNLDCTGCWAKDYSKTDSMSFELLDRIITEGKEIGIYFYLYSGGEPLMRKKDIISLCEKHNDCYFMSFTNATLIDDAFAAEVARVGNYAPAISIEGFEKETDFRRGEGVYKKAINAMRLMRKHGNLFGYSTAYHRLNTEVVGSEDFINSMQHEGCHFGWYFTYMPVGSDAQASLVVTPEQRKFMYHSLRTLRKKTPMFILDFWNDGEFVNGCVAGGRQYLHINARGDVEPCAFIHYSNVNIRNMSLQEALKQPLFEQYRINQPFNNNHLRPCPALDNPHKLREMVQKSKATATQLNDHGSAEEFTAKCEEHAEGWAKVADVLQKNKKRNGSKVSEPVLAEEHV